MSEACTCYIDLIGEARGLAIDHAHEIIRDAAGLGTADGPSPTAVFAGALSLLRWVVEQEFPAEDQAMLLAAIEPLDAAIRQVIAMHQESPSHECN